MELTAILAWLVSGGGAAALAAWLMDKVKWLSELPFEAKRYAALGLTGLLADLFWLAQIGMGYVETPVGWRGWLESLVLVATSAFALSQLLHAHAKARELRAGE